MVARRIRVGTGGAAWTPASLTTLKGWYKADGTMLNTVSGTPANNDYLSQWNDESGGGHHLVSYGGGNQSGQYKSAGLNGHPTVFFGEATTAWMYAGSFALSGTTASLYGYGSITSSASPFRILAGYAAPSQSIGGANGANWVQLSVPTTTVVGNHGGFLSSSTISNDTGARFGSIFDATNNTFVVNATSATPAASGGFTFTTAGRLIIGGDGDTGGPSTADCNWSEIVVTASDLSGGELALLDTYLQRWN